MNERVAAKGNGATPADVLAGRAEWCAVNGDGFALARSLGERAVDHVIGDPPYDEQTHAGTRSMKDKGAATFVDFAALPPIETFLPALVAVARRWTILFCAEVQLGDYKRGAGGARDDGGAWVRAGIWHRTNSTPQITGDRPAAGCEALAVLHAPGGKMRWNRGGNQAFWEGPICRDPHRMHPTKKPLWLMEALIRDFTDPGDIILDPTMGEGTTGEAALRLGRRFIGAELATGVDPATGCYEPARDYYSAAVRRLARAASAPRQAMLLGTDAAPVVSRAKPAKGAGKTVEMWPAPARPGAPKP